MITKHDAIRIIATIAAIVGLGATIAGAEESIPLPTPSNMTFTASALTLEDVQYDSATWGWTLKARVELAWPTLGTVTGLTLDGSVTLKAVVSVTADEIAALYGITREQMPDTLKVQQLTDAVRYIAMTKVLQGLFPVAP